MIQRPDARTKAILCPSGDQAGLPPPLCGVRFRTWRPSEPTTKTSYESLPGTAPAYATRAGAGLREADAAGDAANATAATKGREMRA